MVCKNPNDCPYKGAMNRSGNYACGKKIGLMCTFSVWENGDGKAEITQRRKARQVGSGNFAIATDACAVRKVRRTKNRRGGVK